MKLFSKTKRFLETISIITFLIFTGVISCSKGFNDHKPVSVFKGKNLVTFGNSITIADNSWAYQTFTKLEFGNLYNGAFGGARLCKTTLSRSGQIFVTQYYDDPDFVGIANNWSDTTATGYQKIANNCGIVHIQKYLAEHGDRIPNFIILSFLWNKRPL